MEIQIILSFLAASVLLTLMPGPDNIFVLTESITKGKKTGVAISIGLSSGILVHTLAAATGLSVFLQQSPTAFMVVKWLGVGYLLYLAVMGAKEQAPAISLKKNQAENKTAIQLIRQGFLMSVLNPKVSLFFVAFLPQFIRNTTLHASIQMAILGFIFMLQAVLIFSTLSFVSGGLSAYLNRASFWRITKWLKFSVMLALAFSLAFF